MILASILNSLDSIVAPFANLFGWVLAAFFSFTHSYGLSIVLLTLLSMIIVFPLMRAGTRSMMQMQLLAPELQKIRNRYKAQPGMSMEERQASRTKLNEEMMALYRENGVNYAGGCLPMVLQFPIFWILYDVIRGMTREVTPKGSKVPVLQPQYIPQHTALYHSVLTANGHLQFLGVNLANSVRTPGSFASKIPYILVILIAVIVQYVSIWQITNRNPTAKQTNSQMQAVQKLMPLFFVFFYIVLPAGVGIYFIVSGLFRIGQQEYMYKHDPKIVATIGELRKRQSGDQKDKPVEKQPGQPQRASGKTPAPPTAPRRGFLERLRDAAAGFQGAPALGEGSPESGAAPGAASDRQPGRQQRPSRSQPSNGRGSTARSASTNGTSTTAANGARPGRSGGTKRQPSPKSGTANRARDKRRRRS